MPDDNVIRVGVVADIADVQRQMDAAAASVQGASQKMAQAAQQNATAFTTLQTASVQMAAQLKSQGTTGTEAAEVMKALGFSAAETSAALEQISPGQLPQLDDAAKKATYSITEARIAAQGLSQEFGLNMPRALSSFLARSSTIGPVLSGAFSVVAAVAFLEVADRIARKLEEGAEDLVGWGAAAKKAYAEAASANLELINRNIESNALIVKQNEIGIEGAAKHTIALKNLSGEQKEWASALSDTERQINRVQKEIDRLNGEKLLVFAGSMGDMSKWNEKMKEAQENLDRLQKSATEQQGKVTSLKVGISGESAEAGADARKAAIANGAAKVEADKRVADETLAVREQSIRQLYALNAISLDDEIKQLKDAETKKIELDRAYYTERQKFLVAEGATGKDITPQSNALHGEQEAAELRHQAALSAIDATGAEERKRQSDQVALAQIAATETVALKQIQVAEEWARNELATKKITQDEETALLITAENEQYTAQATALNARRSLALADGKKGKVDVIALNAELESLEIEHQGKLSQIKAEGEAKALEAGRRESTEELRAAEESANKTLETTHRLDGERLKAHQITLGTWAADEHAALVKWESDQEQAFKKALAFAATAYGKESQEYKALLDKLAQLKQTYAAKDGQVDEQIAANFQKALNSMQSHFNTFMTQWITGQETLSKSFGQMWDSAVSSFTQNMLKMVEQMIVAFATQDAILKTSILHTAGDAAAKAYDAMAGIPVVGPELGAVAAAATFAAVTAFGSFAKGGIVPNDMIAQVHKNEMVLPAHVSATVQAASAMAMGRVVMPESTASAVRHTGAAATDSSSAGSAGAQYHNHNYNFSPTINNHPGAPEMTEAGLAKMWQSAVRNGRVKMG